MLAAGDTAAGCVPWIPVSWGELLDKISILELKATRIDDPRRCQNVERELALLRGVRERTAVLPESVMALSRELAATNARLWEIEDELRRLDREGEFGPCFVTLAQAVYRTNDRRAALKRRIDELMGSALVEEKWYPTSRTGGARPRR
jgi:hypothetical protein